MSGLPTHITVREQIERMREIAALPEKVREPLIRQPLHDLLGAIQTLSETEKREALVHLCEALSPTRCPDVIRYDAGGGQIARPA